MARHVPERPDENLGWLLATASHALATELTAALDEVGVSPRAHCVLATAARGEYSQTELATALSVDKTTLLVTIDALEKAGLLERRGSSADRRVRVIAVTDAGRKRIADGERIAARVHGDVLGSLPDGLAEPLVAALQHLVHHRLCDAADCGEPVKRRKPRSAAAA